MVEISGGAEAVCRRTREADAALMKPPAWGDSRTLSCGCATRPSGMRNASSPNRNRQPLIDSMLRQRNKSTPRFGLLKTWRTLILSLWGVLLACAYLALSLLPVIGFRDRRRGLRAGLSMFLLGILMEAGQQFSPGRAVELGDVIANGAGVSCGALLGLPIRACIAIL